MPVENVRTRMISRRTAGALPTALLAGLMTVDGAAQSAEALIKKLVDKGILTVEEANQLRDESAAEERSPLEEALPDWVTSLRITGDLRARYEMFHSDDPTFIDRHRFRFRVRPGIVATFKDQLELGFRLTSSEEEPGFGGDPLSGNATFQDNGSKKFVFIDLAYGKWTPVKTDFWSAAVTVGKMENPFVFSDLVFDRDYTPEGFGQQLTFNFTEAHQASLNLGQFALDEIGASSRDPFLFGAQARLDSKWSDQIASSLGIGALTITDEQNLSEDPATGNSDVPNVNSGNTRENGVLASNFNPFIVDAAVTGTLESFPCYPSSFPIRLAADYMQNPGANEHNEGYSLGVTFGKAGKKGRWELGYRWKHLEANAWYEELVDSDFGGLRPARFTAAGTLDARASYAPGLNVEGHIFKVNYSPFDALTIGITYTLAELIARTPADFDEEIGRLQLDALWKF